VRPVPEGHPTVSPYLIVNDGAAALDFYKKAFGAVELMRHTDPTGKVGHAEITIGDSVIMLADEFPDFGARSPQSIGGSPVGIHLYVEGVDCAGEPGDCRPAPRWFGGAGSVLRRSERHVRGSIRAHLAHLHAHRGRASRRSSRDGLQRSSPLALVSRLENLTRTGAQPTVRR